MTKILSVAAVLVLLVGTFMLVKNKPGTKQKGQTSQTASESEPYLGELGPYFTDKDFHYVGTFYTHNFSYILAGDEGTLSFPLSENIKVVDIWNARELTSIIVQQSETKKFVLLNPANPETKGLSVEQLTFRDAPQESDIAQGWARASSPESFPQDRKKGKTTNWVFIESASTPTGRRQVYVGDEIKTNEKYNCRIVPLLEVFQTHYRFYLDPDKKKFAPVRTDEFGIEKEERKYRDITPGGVGEAVLKAISSPNK